MPREPIPEDLRRFILTNVPSVPFVEALLVYLGAEGAPVSVEAVAARLYVSRGAIADVLDQLVAARIVVMEAAADAHRYQPATPELAAVVEQLAFFYRTQLVAVTELIHSRTLRRAQQFADAFRLRKDS